MKVLLVTRELNGVMGGLERQIVIIANSLSERGIDVVITSLEKSYGRPFFEVNRNRVKFISIISGDPRYKASWETRIQRQRQYYKILLEEKPDTIISFMIGSFLFAKPFAILLRIPVILSERNSPDIYHVTSARKFRWLYLLIASSAQSITVQFPSYIKKYPSFIQRRIVSIPNQVPRFDGKKTTRKTRQVVFGYAGRLSFQKRIDVLIHSFSRMQRDFPDTKLLIFGYGEQKERLEKIVFELNLSNKVEFRKEREEVSEIFDEIDIFCLFSLWEGFPNVLAEALAYGIPSAGFSSCDGVNDLILDGINGWKIPYEDSIFSGHQLLVRAYYGFKNKEVSKDSCQKSVVKYSSDEIYDLWENLITKVSKN